MCLVFLFLSYARLWTDLFTSPGKMEKIIAFVAHCESGIWYSIEWIEFMETGQTSNKERNHSGHKIDGLENGNYRYYYCTNTKWNQMKKNKRNQNEMNIQNIVWGVIHTLHIHQELQLQRQRLPIHKHTLSHTHRHTHPVRSKSKYA